MNRHQLVQSVAKDLGCTQLMARQFIDSTLGSIASAIERGERVQ